MEVNQNKFRGFRENRLNDKRRGKSCSMGGITSLKFSTALVAEPVLMDFEATFVLCARYATTE